MSTCRVPIDICGQKIPADHVLFKHGDGCCESQPFTVGPQAAIISGFEFSDKACATLEMVAGCGAGEYFQPLRKGCGCPLGLNEKNTQLVVSTPGRYRLVWCDCDVDEAYVELRYGTAPVALENNMASSCCGEAAPTLVSTNACIVLASPSPTVQTIALDIACLCTALTPCIQALIPPSAAAHNPTVITSDPAISITGGGASQNFVLTFQEVEAASQLASNPASVSILCAALTPCIQSLIPPPGASTLIVGDAPIIATPIAGGYKIGIDPAYTPHAPAALSSPDGTVTVVVSGADNQNFSLSTDCAALKAKCGFLTVADAATLCTWAGTLPNVGPLQV